MAFSFDSVTDFVSSGNDLLTSANQAVDSYKALETKVAGSPAIVPAAAPVSDTTAKAPIEEIELPTQTFFGKIAASAGLPVWSILTIIGAIVLLFGALILKKILK